MQIKHIFTFIIPIISAVTIPVHDHVDPRSPIAFGRPLVPGRRPFVVALEKNGYVHCGGTLISNTAVLTARSCADSLGDGITVRAGSTVSYKETCRKTASPLADTASRFSRGQEDLWEGRLPSSLGLYVTRE